MKTMSRKLLAVFGTSVLLGWMVIGCSSHSSLMQPTSSSGNGPIIDVTSNSTQESPARYEARLHTELSAGYYTRKQYQVALEEVATALKIDAQYGPAYGMMALIHASLGDNTGAENAFIRATQVSPNDPDIRNNFGAFLCERRRFKESVDQFEFSIRNPLYQTPQVALRNAAECASKGGDTERATRFYQKLGQPVPEMPSNTPASTVNTTKSLSQTTPVSSPVEPQAVAISPAESAFRSANNAYEQGDLLTAQDFIKQALQSPQPTPAMIHLAMCIERRFANSREEDRYADLLVEKHAKSAQARSLNTINRGCS